MNTLILYLNSGYEYIFFSSVLLVVKISIFYLILFDPVFGFHRQVVLLVHLFNSEQFFFYKTYITLFQDVILILNVW